MASATTQFPFFPSLLILTVFFAFANADTVNDLAAQVRASDAYHEIGNNICAKCTLAGADTTGCWGQEQQSGVYISECSLATCFCDEAKAQDVVDGMNLTADKLARECDSTTAIVIQLAVDGYIDFCAEIGSAPPITTPTDFDDPESSSSSKISPTNSDPSPTNSDPLEDDGLSRGDKIDLGVGIGIGLGVGIPTLWATIYYGRKAILAKARDQNAAPSSPNDANSLELTSK